MGWLGWTETEALSADVNTIQVAMRGKVAMLRAIFGGGESEQAAPSGPETSPRPMSPELFDALF
jgi:hypothetical protein